MADTSNLIKVEGSATGDYQDSVVQTYRVQYDSVPTNYYNALSRAQAAGGSPIPLRRTAYLGSGISPPPYCMNLHGGWENENNRSVWLWAATFTVPPPGQQDEDQQNENPLLRPPILNVRYIERERVIDKAKNVENLLYADNGSVRAPNTLGPIVNAAGTRPDEPQLDTERLEVLVIEKNYPSLAAIVTRNRTYKRTTNSDSPQGYSPRELRYLITESVGKQFENGVEFWPGVTEILAETTTDLILDNVGYEYRDVASADAVKPLIRAVDANGDFLAEPINLRFDGFQNGGTVTQITYRYLTETAYTSLFT